MSAGPDAVYQAIERWESESLIDAELAGRLRSEVAATSEAGARRLAQVILAATGAIVLIIAGGVFLEWAWPRMTEALRTYILAGAGVVVYVGGTRLERFLRWIPAAYFTQIAGLALLLGAAMYSYEAWENQTPAAIGAGLAGLVFSVGLAPRTVRRGAFMPSVHLVFSLGFLAIFLDRATALDADAIIWILDGALLVAAGGLVWLLRGDSAGESHPWALNAFVSSLYSGFVLVGFTAGGPLDMGNDAVYPLDLWLFLVAALTVWGIHRAPPGLRRSWFQRQMAYCLIAWVPLGMFTAMEAMSAPAEVALLFVGGAGVAGFLYASRHRFQDVMATSALAFVVVVWFWAVERAGALGAVFALVFTAGLLIWLSGRWGGRGEPAA